MVHPTLEWYGAPSGTRYPFTMRPFEKLLAWQAAHALALRVYALSGSWPLSERFGLCSQVRRAAVSVVANLAEGTAKRGRGELRRYLDIANGSVSEVNALLLLARDLKYLKTDEWAELDELSSRTGRLLFGLYRKTGRG